MEEADKAPAAGASRGEFNGTILLVEDEQAVRLVVRRTLMRYGYDVVEACNGLEALRILEERARNIDIASNGERAASTRLGVAAGAKGSRFSRPNHRQQEAATRPRPAYRR